MTDDTLEFLLQQGDNATNKHSNKCDVQMTTFTKEGQTEGICGKPSVAVVDGHPTCWLHKVGGRTLRVAMENPKPSS